MLKWESRGNRGASESKIVKDRTNNPPADAELTQLLDRWKEVADYGKSLMPCAVCGVVDLAAKEEIELDSFLFSNSKEHPDSGVQFIHPCRVGAGFSTEAVNKVKAVYARRHKPTAHFIDVYDTQPAVDLLSGQSSRPEDDVPILCLTLCDVYGSIVRREKGLPFIRILFATYSMLSFGKCLY